MRRFKYFLILLVLFGCQPLTHDDILERKICLQGVEYYWVDIGVGETRSVALAPVFTPESKIVTCVGKNVNQR